MVGTVGSEGLYEEYAEVDAYREKIVGIDELAKNAQLVADSAKRGVLSVLKSDADAEWHGASLNAWISQANNALISLQNLAQSIRVEVAIRKPSSET